MIEKSRTLFSRIFVVALILLIILSESHWETTAPFVGSALFLMGIILAGIAALGRLWCSLYIAGYKTDTLITEGPYSMCRNPLYFLSFIGALGVGFTSKTFMIPLFILVAFGAYYPFVIKSEEARLKIRHKNKFSTYFDKVPRIFPKISYLTEPAEYIVKPIVFKKDMLDAIWFIWIIGIMGIIETLHELNIIPALFKIY